MLNTWKYFSHQQYDSTAVRDYYNNYTKFCQFSVIIYFNYFFIVLFKKRYKTVIKLWIFNESLFDFYKSKKKINLFNNIDIDKIIIIT